AASAASVPSPTVPVMFRPAPRSEPKEHDRGQLEEELSVAKALLMLSNVSLSMDFSGSSGANEDSSPAQVVHLRGNAKFIKLLITLKQK
ncbi:unnamed protein product, partial [Polarella glacialis]